VTLILLILFLYGFVGFSRSVFIMDFVLTLCLVAGVRIAIRLYLLRDTAFIHSFFACIHGANYTTRQSMVGIPE
jgi:FlaA1/EpsC-like NDP-sugar epimerase